MSIMENLLPLKTLYSATNSNLEDFAYKSQNSFAKKYIRYKIVLYTSMVASPQE